MTGKKGDSEEIPVLIEALPTEVEALHEFERTCFPHVVDVFSIRQLRYLITNNSSRVFLLKINRKIVGEIIGLIRNFSIPSGRIYKIGVSKAYRGRNFGTKMIQKMERIFRKEKMYKSCAEIRISNTASRRLFESNGYKVTNTLTAYYEDGENGLKVWKILR